jgi:hypothetical protein
MDASVRDGGASARLSELRAETRPRSILDPGDDRAGPPLAGLRVALVHDWLTGMRGGEKCLEVLCRAFPRATLFTLFHRRGALSPPIDGTPGRRGRPISRAGLTGPCGGPSRGRCWRG